MIEDTEAFAGVFEKLRRRNLLLNREEPAEVRRVSESLEVLPLLVDMSGFFAVRRDGIIEAYSFDDLENPRTEDNQRICNTVWFRGSQIYPELAAFVPTRGTDSVVCPHCNGTGIVPNLPPELSDKVVCYCGGLGWIPPEP